MMLLKTLTTSALLTSLAAAGAATLATSTSTTTTDSVDMSAAMAAFTVKGSTTIPEDSRQDKLPAMIMKFQRPTVGGGGSNNTSGDYDSGATDLAQDRTGHTKWKQVARTMIDSSGTFEFKNIEEGSYQLRIGDPEKSYWAIKSISVRGKDLDVGKVELTEPENQREKRGRIGGGNNDDSGNSNGNDRRRGN